MLKQQNKLDENITCKAYYISVHNAEKEVFMTHT